MGRVGACLVTISVYLFEGVFISATVAPRTEIVSPDLCQTVQQPDSLAIKSGGMQSKTTVIRTLNTCRVNMKKRPLQIRHHCERETNLFFCSLTSCIALSFCSSVACAETMCAVCSCSVSECFLHGG